MQFSENTALKVQFPDNFVHDLVSHRNYPDHLDNTVFAIIRRNVTGSEQFLKTFFFHSSKQRGMGYVRYPYFCNPVSLIYGTKTLKH